MHPSHSCCTAARERRPCGQAAGPSGRLTDHRRGHISGEWRLRRLLHRSCHAVKPLRVFSLPLLHRGDRLTNSVSVWFTVLAFGVAFWICASGLLRSLGMMLALLALPFFVFWFSAHLQRMHGLHRLAQHACPGCGLRIGRAAAEIAFEGYSRSCLEFIQSNRGAFSIDLGSPLGLHCRGCSQQMFYDYLDSDSLSLTEDSAPPDSIATTSAT